MTIASKITSNPVGISFNGNAGDVAPGTLVEGDKGSKFLFVKFNTVAAVSLFQGQGVLVDEEFNAFLLGASSATPTADLGTLFGTAYFGAKLGNDGNTLGDTWSIAVPAGGSQGIWVQTRGVSAAYVGAITAGDAVYYNYTSAPAAGYITQATAPSHSNTLTGVGVKAVHLSLASCVVNANNSITIPSQIVGLRVGACVSGTGINNGTYVAGISGSIVSLVNSLGLAPVSAAGTVTVTFDSNKFWVASAGASTTYNVPAGPLNTFVGATLTDASSATATVLAVDGNSSKGWVVTLSAALTTNASANEVTSTAVYEVFLNDPFVSANT